MPSKSRLFASVLQREGDVVTFKQNTLAEIDSNFISSRETVIDSAYISARQTREVTRRTQTITDSAETTIDTFSGATIRTAKYVVSAQTALDSHHQSQEILLSHDDSTATLTTYATLLHGDQTIVTYDAEYSGGTISLKADPQGYAGLKFGIERTVVETV
tara:strand:- start:1233 stop:1712 length:480 start_codon:yes stop_codon:yes gene_type:complete